MVVARSLWDDSESSAFAHLAGQRYSVVDKLNDVLDGLFDLTLKWSHDDLVSPIIDFDVQPVRHAHLQNDVHSEIAFTDAESVDFPGAFRAHDLYRMPGADRRDHAIERNLVPAFPFWRFDLLPHDPVPYLLLPELFPASPEHRDIVSMAERALVVAERPGIVAFNQRGFS